MDPVGEADLQRDVDEEEQGDDGQLAATNRRRGCDSVAGCGSRRGSSSVRASSAARCSRPPSAAAKRHGDRPQRVGPGDGPVGQQRRRQCTDREEQVQGVERRARATRAGSTPPTCCPRRRPTPHTIPSTTKTATSGARSRSCEITTIGDDRHRHAPRPHLMAVTAVEKATAEERAEHVAAGRSDEHQADPAVVGSDPVAKVRQRGTGKAQRHFPAR